MRKYGPKSKDHPSIGESCPACRRPFKEGDYTTIVPVGPGDDEESRERCAQGRPYNAVGIEVHWLCSEYPYKYEETTKETKPSTEGRSGS